MSQFNLGPKQLQQALERVMLRGLVPYVQGSPGIGKSDIFKQIAKKFNLKVLDTRLASAAPEDLNGLPFRNGNKAAFLPFENFPIKGDPLPVETDNEGNITHRYDGWLILLDELSSAPKSVQAAAYKLILDQEVGIHPLHECVMLCAAGNKATDRAVVVPQSTALQSRLVHYTLEVSKPDWMDYALENKWDSRILGFIEYKPQMLYQFRPDHQDKTFLCPRTWGFVNTLIQGQNDLDYIDTVNIAGCITDGGAVEFQKFTALKMKMPKIEDIIFKPLEADVPGASDVRYFVISALMDHTTKESITNIFKYIKRFPEEYQVIFIRGIAKRSPEFRVHPAYMENIRTLLHFIHEDQHDEFAPT